MRLKTIFIASMIATLSLTPVASQAGLDDALSSMWMSASSSAGAYNSPTRKGFVGGSYTMRWPSRSYQLVQFDPPRINAGCSGIDIHMGAFSFINAEQFKQMIRQIGSSAVGYFFKTALENMCPICNAVLTSLEDAARMIDSGNMNSCAIGAKLGTAMGQLAFGKEQDAADTAMELTSGVQAAWGNFTDRIASNMKQAFEPSGQRASSQTDPAQSPFASPFGNQTWKALKSKNISKSIQSTFGDSEEMLMYLMNIMGIVIMPPADETKESKDCPSGAICRSQGVVLYKSTMDMNTLVDGIKGKEDFMIFSCEDNATDATGCTKVSLTKMPFNGIRAYVHNMFFGHNDPNDPSVFNSGILDNMINGTQMTTKQQAFLEAIPGIPLKQFALGLQKDKASLTQMIGLIEPMVVESMALALAFTVQDVINKSFSGNDESGEVVDLIQPLDLSDVIKKNDAFIAEAISKSGERIQKVNLMADSVNKVYAATNNKLTQK